MKQRTRLMLNGNELVGNNVNMNRSNDSHNELQLHRVKPQDHFIEAQVQEGDTLQAIALRFYCSISELRRINHIHKDNEIFARRTIKVPVTPYSVLTEVTPSQDIQPTTSTSMQNVKNFIIPNLLQNANVNNGSIDVTRDGVKSIEIKENDCAIDCNTVVLNSTLTPSVFPYTDTEQNEEAISEDTQLLPNKQKIPMEAVVVKELTSHGADFGLKWFHLVSCMLILGVVMPLVYVLFYLDKHEHSDVPPLHPT